MNAARATDSALVRRTVEQAEALGLVVTVTREELYGMASVAVVVKRPHVEPVTLLDVVDNVRGLHLHALRSPGGLRWTHAAWSMGYTADSKLSRLKLVPYVVRDLSEGVAER